MNVAAPADLDQPDTFEFTKENVDRAKEIVTRYPEGRQGSALMPLLEWWISMRMVRRYGGIQNLEGGLYLGDS